MTIPQIVSFSGGKDSTAMLLRMIELDEPFDDVIMFDGGWEFPQMYKHVQQVEEYTGRKITIVKPKKSFDYMLMKQERKRIKGPDKGEILIGYGWPGPLSRWCTRVKVDTIRKYIKRRFGNDPFIDCIGIAADEPKRIRQDENERERKRYPLVEWGWTESDAMKYCFKRGFDWGGAYQNRRRLSCWCCPLQRKDQLRLLYDTEPELWQKLKTMAEIVISRNDTVPIGHKNYWQKRPFSQIERMFQEQDKQNKFIFSDVGDDEE